MASGFSHKLPELVHTVLAKLADLRVAEDRFEASISRTTAGTSLIWIVLIGLSSLVHPE